MTLRAPVAMWMAAVALVLPGSMAFGQAGGPSRVTQAVYQPAGPTAGGPMVRSADYVDAHGDAAVMPVQYAMSGGGYYDDMQGAYGGVAFNTDQVGPHYFDVSMEFVSYTRDRIFANNTTLFTENFVGSGPGATPVLSTGDIDPGYEPGFRITGRYDVGPLSVIEFGYTGLFDMDNTATFVDPNPDLATGLGNIFSIFTGFGGPAVPGGIDPTDVENFEETDRATSASIEFTSDLQSTEVSYRRYWVGYSPRVTGTLLAGFRYTKLQEGFRMLTVGANFNPGDAVNAPTGGISRGDYQVFADNNLAGLQLGGDMWVGVVQGLRVGAEGKAGIYNNAYEVRSTFNTTDGDPLINESFKNDQVAFISEAKLQIVADLLPSLSVRGGYEVLFMSSLALAGDNLNTGSPYTTTAVPARVAFVEDQSEALFHGWNVGFEYIW